MYTARVISHVIGLALALVILMVPALAGARDARDAVAALGLVKPNPAQAAKPFEVETPDKRVLRLSEFKGKVVFLNFWATWCKPCEEEMPGMERLYRKFKDKGLVVLAISEDAAGAEVVAPFVKKHGLTFPIGLDPAMSLAASYGVWALPATFIIDRQGNRAHFANGPREWDGQAGQAFFESMLK
jgi:peroxiredoxin